MKILTETQKELLAEPLPSAAISQHPTKKYLSSIKSIYVSERISQVFGVGSWNLESEIIDFSTKMVVLKVTLIIEEYGIKLSHYGGNDNSDKGDAFKGAMSDALTKIAAVYLGIGSDVYKGVKSAPKPVKKAPKKIDYTKFDKSNVLDIIAVYTSKPEPPIDKIKDYINKFDVSKIGDNFKQQIITIDSRLDIFGNN